MRRLLALTICLIGIALSAPGCACTQWCCDSMARSDQKKIDSESKQPLDSEWRRGGWNREQPEHLTPYRIHGGVGPASSSI